LQKCYNRPVWQRTVVTGSARMAGPPPLYLAAPMGSHLHDGTHLHLKSLLAVHIIAAREERTQA